MKVQIDLLVPNYNHELSLSQWASLQLGRELYSHFLPEDEYDGFKKNE